MLRLSQEIVDMICDMLFTFDRKHVLAATQHLAPWLRQTPAYFPLSWPPRCLSCKTHKKNISEMCHTCILSDAFYGFCLSEVIEVAKRLQYQAPTEVEKLSWILPTCEITKFLTT